MAKYVVDSATGCWNWTGYVRSDGYGEIQLGRRGVGAALAHRVSYELHVGPIPDGMEPDHICRNRACGNPAHLEAVTRTENIVRGEAPAAVRAAMVRITHCPQGHEYTPENTYVARTARGYTNRMCRTCQRERMRQRRARR